LLTTVTWTAYYATTANTFGTLASPTRTQIATGTFTVTSALTNYSAQISIPAAATTGIEVVLTVGAQTSGTWVVGNMQLEKGSTATSFDYRPYGTEFALCQRYYSRGSSYLQTFGTAGGGSNLFSSTFKVTMRVAPTAVVASTIAGSSTSINFITVDQLAFTGIPDGNGRVAGTWTASSEL
jgi:hypothetical protein